MPKPQKRNNTYYLDRLKRDHPKIHADYLAGKFPSALQAFEAAGLKRAPHSSAGAKERLAEVYGWRTARFPDLARHWCASAFYARPWPSLGDRRQA